MPGRISKAPDTKKSGVKKAAPAAQKILFAVSEVAPFVSTGGMGQVVSSLPKTLQEVSKTTQVRVVAPYYRQVCRQFGSCMTFIGSVEVRLAWRSLYCGVLKAERDGIVYYFIDNKDYFDRDECYGHYDDGERFAFFSKAVLSIFGLIDYVPDVIHAHDWQTALIPIYLKTTHAADYPAMRSVFTVHNIEYQGQFSPAILGDVFDLRGEDLGIVEYQGCLNLVKGAVVACDRLTTVSPSYAEEIKADGGYGLEPIIREHAGKLTGIINGIDDSLYNPATDPSLAGAYTADNLAPKEENKRALQRLFDLKISPRTPLLCMVSRLVAHKGLDLLPPVMDELLSDDVQLLILGTGEHEYELYFTELAIRHPGKVAVNIAFNPEISSKIYGGADIMLMPSRSEPCGLSQMIACRYGTVPVVRATGGLKDTIRDCRSGDGNGFLFGEYDAKVLLGTVRDAIGLYRFHEDDWRNLMREGMRSDFCWAESAKAYAALYEGLR